MGSGSSALGLRKGGPHSQAHSRAGEDGRVRSSTWALGRRVRVLPNPRSDWQTGWGVVVVGEQKLERAIQWQKAGLLSPGKKMDFPDQMKRGQPPGLFHDEGPFLNSFCSQSDP